MLEWKVRGREENNESSISFDIHFVCVVRQKKNWLPNFEYRSKRIQIFFFIINVHTSFFVFAVECRNR